MQHESALGARIFGHLQGFFRHNRSLSIEEKEENPKETSNETPKETPNETSNDPVVEAEKEVPVARPSPAPLRAPPPPPREDLEASLKKEIRRLTQDICALRSQSVHAGLTPYSPSETDRLRRILTKNQDLRDGLILHLQAHNVDIQFARKGRPRYIRKEGSKRSVKVQIKASSSSSVSSKKDISKGSKKIAFSHPGKHWESAPSIYEPLSGGRAYLTRSALKQQNKNQ